MAKLLPKIKKPILSRSFVSISKAAKFLQVSPDTLRNWEKEGKFLPARTHGGARRYSRTELLKLKKETTPFTSKKKGLMSISQVAKAIKVSPDTLRDWDKKGLVESQRTKGGARRFTREEVRRLQDELGIKEALPEAPKPVLPTVVIKEVIKETPNFSHEVPKFTFPWFKMAFSILLIIFFSATGWLFISYLDPLEKKIDETAKIVAESVQSIESLQRGVLGIQTEQPSPSPTLAPGSPTPYFANYDNGVVLASAEAPLVLDRSTNKLRCTDCLTKDSPYFSVNPLVMNTNGNVGIGINSPLNKLEVAGAQAIGTGYAGVFTAPANGLLVQGNVGIGTAAPSYRLDVAGGGRFGCGNNSWDKLATNCSDIAEVYQSDGSATVGDIVVLRGQANMVTKSQSSYQSGMIGVYSTSPALLIGGQVVLGGSGNLGNNQIPVALAGRVPVKVSDENGPIQVGDYLTSSSIPGVAMKATKPGPVIGRALEARDFFTGEENSTGDTHLVDIRMKFSTVLAFISVSFADPDNFLAALSLDDQGNLIVPKIKTGAIVLDPMVMNTDTNYATSTMDLSGEIASLEDRVARQDARIAALEAQINAGTGTMTQVDTSSSVEPTDNLMGRSADTLELTPPDVLLATSSATLANINVTETLSSDKLFTASEVKISGDLNVFGKSLLAETTVAGDLIVDGTLSVSGNSLNVIGSPACLENKTDCGILYIQDSPLAHLVDFFNGQATIDKSGNFKAQTVTVAAFKVVANKISGSSKIAAGSKSIDIENAQVESSSRILITPNTETNSVLAVTDKAEGKKFTVSVAQPVTQDIVFDWFLVNERPD